MKTLWPLLMKKTKISRTKETIRMMNIQRSVEKINLFEEGKK